MLSYNQQDQLCFFNNNNFSVPLLQMIEQSKYDRPTYIYDRLNLIHRCRFLKNILAPVEIFYALKANSFSPLVRVIVSEGLGLDVVSIGEIECGLKNGCPPDRMIFSGVGKTAREIEMALRLNIKQINVESIPELFRILKISKSLNIKAPVALRVNPDVDASTHPYIATGLKNNKFGIETSALEEAEQILKENKHNLEFMGFSLHIGSQILDLKPFQEALNKLNLIIQKWNDRGWKFKTLDAGGGIGIFYSHDDEPAEELLATQWSDQIKSTWKNSSEHFFVEPGRWLVGHAGVLITRVEYVKKTSNHNFIIVDTGMHHLMRPALYQAKHRVLPLQNKKAMTEKYQIVGPICESSDVLHSEIILPKVEEGDYLAILETGAYGSSMSNFYNQREFPNEILV